MFAPIALFVYNRLAHTRETIDALQKNILASQSDLIIFSDDSKSEAQAEAVREVRKYIHQVDGFKSITIVDRDTNFGLARSIIDGVTSVVNQYGRVIVLEDDLLTSPYFLQYMNDGLNLYRDDERVISLHGYMFPVGEKLPETFFLRDPGCWGWATWRRGWQQFELDGKMLRDEIVKYNLMDDFNFSGSYDYMEMLNDQINGKNDSWAVRWYASAFLNNKLTLYPGVSLVMNVGNDGSGRHAVKTEEFASELASKPVSVLSIEVKENIEVRSILIRYLNRIKQSPIKRYLSQKIHLMSTIIFDKKKCFDQ